MSVPPPPDQEILGASIFYREFLVEREEILRHKWLESEREGHDIGFEHALVDWIHHFRASWLAHRTKSPGHKDNVTLVGPWS